MTPFSNYFAQISGQTTSLPLRELTYRERDILRLIAQELTNAAIAEPLSLGPKTARNQVSIIFSKNQVTGRGEAMIKAREAGLG